MRGDDGPRVARIPGLGEMRDHVGLFEGRDRIQRDQPRIARADADADQCASVGAHSPSLAKAFTAAAVMALPPMRPRTISHGTP